MNSFNKINKTEDLIKLPCRNGWRLTFRCTNFVMRAKNGKLWADLPKADKICAVIKQPF